MPGKKPITCFMTLLILGVLPANAQSEPPIPLSDPPPSAMDVLALERTGPPPLLTLVLSPGDEVAILSAALDHWERSGRCFFPTIVAMEPGPVVLRSGLRLLPNEVAPRLSLPEGDLPRLLVISNMGRLLISNAFLAYLRICLERGVAVWAVGDSMPEDLTALPLAPGQAVILVALSDLNQRLNETAGFRSKALCP